MSNVWMPLYIGDYLADTTHLSAAEHGAYLLLIMTYWQTGGPLPDDDAKLARIARMDPKEWKAARPTLAEFFDLAAGRWTHARIEAELANTSEVRAKKSAAGRASAEARKRQQKGNTCSTGVGTEAPTEGQQEGQQNVNPPPPPPPVEKNPIISANVSARATPESPAAAVRLIGLFDQAQEAVYGPQRRQQPAAKDFTTAQRFLAAGLTEVEAAGVFEAVLRRCLAKGQPAPRSMAYLEQPVADHLAEKAKPLPQGQPGRAAEPEGGMPPDYVPEKWLSPELLARRNKIVGGG